ncbi:MAG: tricarballylate utilization 4Fe-4S protein TcuB, partial [Alphaproteobacteria bacterium]
MSAELSPRLAGEARRQLRICNACRYCEGYCSAFPAITRLREFADADIARIANLCHNCRGCYYACQYTAPHEFDLNLPAILAEARRESWQGYIRPRALGRLFHTNGWATVAATLAGFVLIWLAIRWLGGQEGGGGFYAALSHSAMVALFLPAFLLPLAGLGLGLAAFWREIGGRPLRRREIGAALAQAARLQDLSGGQGQGCNFERAERYSNARRHAHHAVLWGFLLCFAATVAGTVMHYGLGQPAPYHLWSVPKLLGIPGGVLLL